MVFGVLETGRSVWVRQPRMAPPFGKRRKDSPCRALRLFSPTFAARSIPSMMRRIGIKPDKVPAGQGRPPVTFVIHRERVRMTRALDRRLAVLVDEENGLADSADLHWQWVDARSDECSRTLRHLVLRSCSGSITISKGHAVCRMHSSTRHIDSSFHFCTSGLAFPLWMPITGCHGPRSLGHAIFLGILSLIAFDEHAHASAGDTHGTC